MQPDAPDAPDPPTPAKPKRERRPDYDRIRRFLAKGGVLQREVIQGEGVAPWRYVVWHAAARDGRNFDAETCEWLKGLATFRLDGSDGWLEEGPRPGIFRRVPDIHPTLGEAAHYTNPDGERHPGAPAPEPEEGP